MKKIILGIFMTGLALMFAMPATAQITYKPAEDQVLTLYGHVVFGSFYIDQDIPGEDNNSDLFFDLYSSSRIGGNYESGDIFGNWELGLSSGSGETSVYLRQIYARWSINGDMSITLGQKLSPYLWPAFTGAAGDNSGVGYGSLYDGFTPRITLTYKGFYIDAAAPHTSDLRFDDDTLAGRLGYDYDDDVEFEKKIPRMAVGYDYTSGTLSIGGGLGYNTFRMKLSEANFDKTVRSWVAFLHGEAAVSSKIKLRACGWYGVNPIEYGVAGLSGPIDGNDENALVVVNPGVNSKVEDTRTYAGHVEIHVDLGKAVARAGYGYARSDNDTFAEADAHQEYWVNAEVPLFKGVHGTAMSVQPEVHVFDQMKDINGNDERSALYVGARWNLDF